MDNNNWQTILEVLTNQVINHLDVVGRDDLLKFCANDKGIRNVLLRYIDDFRANMPTKSIKIAVKKREEGNSFFQKKCYAESLSLYTQSISYAPSNDESLPKAYWNRSSALLFTGHLEECLQDLEMAFLSGYPSSDDTKLLLRKAKCLGALNKVNEAMEILQNTLKNIDKCCQKNKDAYKKKIMHEITILKEKGMQNANELTKEDEISKLEFRENPDFKAASKFITLKYTKSKGRHVIANEDILMGDILFLEKPFTHVVLKNVCHSCCSETLAPIPCLNCIDVTYCSLKCKDADFQLYHQFECQFHQLLNSVGIAHLGLRVLFKASNNFEKLVKIVNKLDRKNSLKENGNLIYKNEDYQNVYDLVNNISHMQLQDLFQYCVTSLLLSLFVQRHTTYFQKPCEEDLTFFANLVLRHITQLVGNAHAITSLVASSPGIEDNFDTITQERIGTAIYPSASMMNHSCEPSIINSFYKNCLIVRACKNIKAGEEVYNCYGPHCRKMSKQERQEILSSQYFFECNCVACSMTFDYHDKYTALKCESCRGALVPATQSCGSQTDLRNENDFKNRLCLNCGEYELISQLKSKKSIEVHKLLEKGESLLCRNDVEKALHSFLECWKLGREVLYKHNKHLVFAADQVAKCLSILKDYRRSSMFLKCVLLSIEDRYGPYSVELANELKKTGDVILAYATEQLQNNLELKQAMDNYERAQGILTLLYGPNHRSVLEIIKIKSSLHQK